MDMSGRQFPGTPTAVCEPSLEARARGEDLTFEFRSAQDLAQLGLGRLVAAGAASFAALLMSGYEPRPMRR
jgi:hypothetical protein